jgi:hypothetical protein
MFCALVRGDAIGRLSCTFPSSSMPMDEGITNTNMLSSGML